MKLYQEFVEDPQLFDEPYVHLSWCDFFGARVEIVDGKAFSKDNIPKSMLCLLDAEMFSWVHWVFQRRFNQVLGYTNEVDDLAKVDFVGIPKDRNVERMEQWIYICIGANLQKWYEVVLFRMVDQHSLLLPKQLFGHRKGCQPTAITETFRLFFEKAEEWMLPFLVAQLDVQMCFDSIPIVGVVEVYEKRGIPKRFIAAIFSRMY